MLVAVGRGVWPAVRSWVAGSLLSLACVGLVAQTVPVTPPSATPQPVVPTPAELAGRPAAPVTDPKDLPPRPPPPRELAKPEADLSLNVDRYEVSPDAPQALKDALVALTTPYVGVKRGYEDLVDAAAEVARFLQRDLGYYLGYAYIPEQTPTAGVVRIEILEGRLDQVELRWPDNLPVQRELIVAYLARLKPGDILRVADIERVVFLVNDLRGVNARFDVKAGRQPGTATLVITGNAEPLWTGKADLDVNGSRFLGAARLSGMVAGNSLLGRGDALAANLLVSSTGGLYFALLNYTVPVGSDGLKVGASLSALRYRLSDEIPLKVNGDALTASASVVYPWVRARNFNLFTLAALEHKDFADRKDVPGTVDKKQIDALTLGASGDFRDSLLTGGINTYELTLSTGRLKAQGTLPVEVKDSLSYTKLVMGFNRLQNIVDGRLLLYLSLRAQWARNNLDTSEEFRLGGPDGVRAFAAGEGTGDLGQLLSAELRLLPPEDTFGRWARDAVVSLFYDAGRVQRDRDPSKRGDATFVNTARFAGAGIGVSWVKPGQYGLRLSVAKPLIGTPEADKKIRDPRLYAQFTMQF